MPTPEEHYREQKWKLKIYKTPESHDSDDVRFIDASGNELGYGFRPKEKGDDTTVALEKCPACMRENYAMNVSSGCCTWCPWTTEGLTE